ncbi:MAG: hypothetical protein L0Y60_13500 [Beijerinckiaceae bacterium]|nr:hypothetical protein [Beijerinckiaceae bacterium]
MIAAILEIGTVIELFVYGHCHAGHGQRPQARRAGGNRAAIRVLFTSAYAENSVIDNVELDPAVDFFSKPYDLERLAMTPRRQEQRRPRINRSQRAGSFERTLPAET